MKSSSDGSVNVEITLLASLYSAEEIDAPPEPAFEHVKRSTLFPSEDSKLSESESALPPLVITESPKEATDLVDEWSLDLLDFLVSPI